MINVISRDQLYKKRWLRSCGRDPTQSESGGVDPAIARIAATDG